MSERACCNAEFISGTDGEVYRCNYYEGVPHVRHARIASKRKASHYQTARTLGKAVILHIAAEFEHQKKEGLELEISQAPKAWASTLKARNA